MKKGCLAELKTENEKLTQTCESLLNIQYALAYSCKKYSETLQEIKEIAKNSCCMADKDFCSSNSCTVCMSVSDADVIKQILQIIIKAEEE